MEHGRFLTRLRRELLVKALLKPPPQRDPTLKHPGTVFQILKRYYARYTPEMVEHTTGCPKETVSVSARGRITGCRACHGPRSSRGMAPGVCGR